MTSSFFPGEKEEHAGPLSEVIGAQVVGVRYLVPGGAQWPDGRADGFVHEIDHGVELMLSDDHVLCMQWQMDGENEYLRVSLRSPTHETSDNTLIDAIDVSSAPEWTSLLGGSISSIRISWHIANTGCPRSVWAIRFDVETGASFVVALGEVRDGVPTYLPDSVLVIFDREDAETYRTAGSSTSAWEGELVRAPGSSK